MESLFLHDTTSGSGSGPKMGARIPEEEKTRGEQEHRICTRFRRLGHRQEN